MPSRVKILIYNARDIPENYKSRNKHPCAYVEIRWLDLVPYRTKTIEKSCNPQWNEEYRYEVTNYWVLNV